MTNEEMKNLYEDYIGGTLIKDLKNKYLIDSSNFLLLSVKYHFECVEEMDVYTSSDEKKVVKYIKNKREINKILNKMVLNGARPLEEEVVLFVVSNLGIVSNASLCVPLECPLTTLKRFMKITGVSNDFVQYRKGDSGLTLAQEEILYDLSNGLKKKDIAENKSVTPGCVSGYIKRVRKVVGEDKYGEVIAAGKINGVLNSMSLKSGRSIEEIENIINVSLNKKLNKEIAKEIGCTVAMINRYLKSKNMENEINIITMDYTKRRETVINKIQELYQNGTPLHSGYIKRNYRREIYNRADMFGGYKSMITAAGINYDEVIKWKVNRKYDRGYWTKERVIEKGKQIPDEDLTPKKLCEMGESGFYEAVKKYFGSVKEFASLLDKTYYGRQNTNAGQTRKRKVETNDGNENS